LNLLIKYDKEKKEKKCLLIVWKCT
jgi:hypothetical protein